jgi:hypothetical protein
MAFTAIGSLGVTNDKTTNNTLALTTSAAAEVGNLIVVVVASNNNNTTDGDHNEVTQVTDSAGNTYTKAAEFQNSQGSADAGALVAVFYTVVTTQLNSGATITATWAGARPARVMTAHEFTIGAGNTVAIEGTPATLANDGADPGSMSLSSLPSREYLFVRGFAVESNSATLFGNSGGYTITFNSDQTSGGGSASNMGVRGLAHIATTTSTTNDPTAFNADWASVLIAFYEQAVSSDRRAYVSFAELEAPNAPRRAFVSFAELETPDGARRAFVSHGELEVPTAPRRGLVSFGELELPDAPRRTQVSFAEFEVLGVERQALVSFAEFETPDAPRRGLLSFAELETGDAARRGLISFTELETGDGARRVLLSFAELEAPDLIVSVPDRHWLFPTQNVVERR